MKNQVQLIAYVDRLSGGGFRALQDLLEGPFQGLFGGVHLLPFFVPIDGVYFFRVYGQGENMYRLRIISSLDKL